MNLKDIFKEDVDYENIIEDTFKNQYAFKEYFDGEKYVQTFFDDFSGDNLDLSKWKRSPQQERQPNMKNHGWWKDECSYLEDGKLVIEAKKRW